MKLACIPSTCIFIDQEAGRLGSIGLFVCLSGPPQATLCTPFWAHLCFCTLGSYVSLSVRLDACRSVTGPKLRRLENSSYLHKQGSWHIFTQSKVASLWVTPYNLFSCKLQVYKSLAGGINSTSSCIFRYLRVLCNISWLVRHFASGTPWCTKRCIFYY